MKMNDHARFGPVDSEEGFAGLSRSVRTRLLTHILLAKRPATKAKRAAKIAEWALAGEAPGM